ncbi:Protein of unknown function [Catalinimonas alkaloidigena]|uniref:YetF C-terminal domain-containing protein n=1 Tax=Catalinimonas alkaloidigena TaxID=1075417 RepID=A0A1G9R2G3_9BACT|nr:YetF domain-containing protein [Catalinimonas alkaloidigena]SDM17476.1 Protein of unknown function [Catalinimonas alkaloidigena]
MNDWFLAPLPHVLWIALSCVVYYVFTILTTRLVGLRSFTTFSSFDFLITLAMGALLASTVVSQDVALVEGFTALLALYALQISVALVRTRWPYVRKWVDNPPTLLMENGQVLHRNLRAVRITEDELRAKLRAHNVHNYTQVKAVVLESSGEVSVLYDAHATLPFQPTLLEGVIREL